MYSGRFGAGSALALSLGLSAVSEDEQRSFVLGVTLLAVVTALAMLSLLFCLGLLLCRVC